MSFCSELKNELSSVRPSGCCKSAECYGFMLFSRSFSYKELSFYTENKELADLYTYFLKSDFAILPAVSSGGKKRVNYKVSVTNPQECARVMSAFGYKGTDNLSVNKDIFKKNCCFGSFIRGAFLACGQMSDPEKSYRAEFVIKDIVLALEFYGILMARGLSPKRTMRSMSTVIYFNNSETVEELLTVMNATTKTFELMDVRMTKDFRTQLNRKNNFELGNISKQVNASVDQRNAIEYLEKTGKLELLDPPLLKAAKLRKENPMASLTELCKLSDEPITRSGLNHRLQKIMEKVKEYKQKDLKK